MSEKDVGYDAAHIEVLEGRDAIRKRPGMYVGSTGERGLYQMLFEVADRAVNEVVAGRAGSVDVVLTADGGVRVADDGPGLPVEAAGHTGGPGLETLLTGMTTRESPDDRHAVHLGLFGIGPFVTNALSSRLTAEVRRDGVRWVQEYTRGVAVTRPTAAGPTTRSGTTIAFWPDADVFETVQYSSTVLADRFRELAFLNRGLDISFTDERSLESPGRRDSGSPVGHGTSSPSSTRERSPPSTRTSSPSNGRTHGWRGPWRWPCDGAPVTRNRSGASPTVGPPTKAARMWRGSATAWRPRSTRTRADGTCSRRRTPISTPTGSARA